MKARGCSRKLALASAFCLETNLARVLQTSAPTWMDYKRAKLVTHDFTTTSPNCDTCGASSSSGLSNIWNDLHTVLAGLRILLLFEANRWCVLCFLASLDTLWIWLWFYEFQLYRESASRSVPKSNFLSLLGEVAKSFSQPLPHKNQNISVHVFCWSEEIKWTRLYPCDCQLEWE